LFRDEEKIASFKVTAIPKKKALSGALHHLPKSGRQVLTRLAFWRAVAKRLRGFPNSVDFHKNLNIIRRFCSLSKIEWVAL